MTVMPLPREVSELAQFRRAYDEQLRRIDRLEYEGKRAWPNKRVFAALRSKTADFPIGPELAGRAQGSGP
jgi:hypothetical protein